MESTEATPPVPAKRYEWIDNARLIAALLIIYAHMWLLFPDEPHVTSPLAVNLTHATTLFGRVPYFLILAGYFLARRITWHKAFDRALWLLIPFAAWNIIDYALFQANGLSWDIFKKLPMIMGISCIFMPSFQIFDLPITPPSIGVTWFLRDIIILSLCSPILVRFRYMLLGLLAVVLSFPNLNFGLDGTTMLSPNTCFYYLLGTCLCNYGIEDAYHIFNKRFMPVFIIILLAAVARCFLYAARGKECLQVTLMGSLFGAMVIAYAGVLIETYLPKLSQRLAPCGPACFLVFVLHNPVLRMAAPMLPDWITGTWLIWLLPIPTCAIIIALFLLMKRYTPWLMPYLGHMKVPKKGAS